MCYSCACRPDFDCACICTGVRISRRVLRRDVADKKRFPTLVGEQDGEGLASEEMETDDMYKSHILRATKFGETVTAGHKALNEERESRNNLSQAIVVQDLGTRGFKDIHVRQNKRNQ